MNTPELLTTLSLVQAALAEAQVPHVFIGALPVLAFGRPRATTDLDLVVFCDSTRRFASPRLRPPSSTS